MANIMIRKGAEGYVFYMPKRDIEDVIASMEFDSQEKWGGEIRLKNGGVKPDRHILLVVAYAISMCVSGNNGQTGI